MGAVVLLTGTGHLGGPVLDRLAASEAIDRVVAVGRDAQRGERRCNLARLVAVCGGRSAEVCFRAADLTRPGEVAAVVAEISPDLIIHTASRQTWWLTDLLPAAQRTALRRVGYGPWVPLHLTLALALMRELDEAGYEGATFNAAYPDVVNVVLGRVGRPPTGGLGNIDELVAKVRLGVAARRDDGESIEVRMVAHHAVQRFAFGAAGAGGAGAGDADAKQAAAVGGGRAATSKPGNDATPPFHLSVSVDGEEMTEQLRAREILSAPCPLPSGPAWGSFTAAAAVSFIEAWLADRPSLQHCAGPHGLPGGYPVEVGGGRLRRLEIDGLSAAAARAINERAQRFDGIDAIGDDGTIEFVGESAAAMTALLGFECPRLAPADATEAAAELSERFRRYAADHGVDVGVARLY